MLLALLRLLTGGGGCDAVGDALGDAGGWAACSATRWATRSVTLARRRSATHSSRLVAGQCATGDGLGWVSAGAGVGLPAVVAAVRVLVVAAGLAG